MPIARDYLRCDRSRVQTEPGADALLDFRSNMSKSSDCARDLADSELFGCTGESDQVALQFVVPERQLETEGDRLCMDAMGPANLNCVFEFKGTFSKYFG